MNIDSAASKEAKEIYDSIYKIMRIEFDSSLICDTVKKCSIECVNRIISSCSTDAKVYYEEVMFQIEKL